ncbi:hypothetical protein L226DRAFT_560384 [Lentinus tigrinus ALCF2SS1-7]|uniref:DUF1793-domain-containing protein n=1 Tax=Lentinus tigrinus ALCF2SS1-6 TaxID=1328759 RepID=A0A5C2RVR1_9APHY|nr:hypothetical protein L227DRAFT_580247 [Lentinus tigrinus ALCF2SS1-6]RPD75343.1 hypothetical protein L226DRAFT_560384 [Lentinus tigrinus ALCF2SS1-7]
MTSMLGWIFLLALLLCAVADAQQSFFPASIPLAVRSPHFSVWYDSHLGAAPLSSSWPNFWSGAIIGWAGRMRVDGVTYSWMGSDQIWNNTATVVSTQITPTRSIFVMQAGPMNVTVTFLSPIEPSDWVNQSIPFSYVSVEAQSLDGAAHDVQVYSDISSELVTGIRPSGGNGGDPVSWQSNRTAQALYHETEPVTLRQYTEVSNQAQDGRGYYAMALSPSLTWEIDTDVNCRHQFLNSGNMTNTQVAAFGPMGKPWYVFAIAMDLGNIQSTSSPVTWAIGYVRDPVVPYTTSSGATEVRRPYWTTRYSDISALIDAFVVDYPAAHDRAVAFDEKVMGDAAKVSPQYVDLISLVTRQVMAALDITVLGGSGSNGQTTDVKAFMRDTGSSTRVNPVETMFAAFPTYLYLNASLGGALLAPLLESQDNLSGQPYAAQDIGGNYPNATGTRGAHQQGIEQSGNMLIMMYAHARVSGDGSLLSTHYDTAKRWADYLVNNTLTPLNQDSADGLTNPNMTNLAIKGIIGVKAMAEISRATQHDSDAQQYDSRATALAGSWLSLAESSDQQHLLGQYGDQSSAAMLYNIYADLLLDTALVPQDILAKQTQYYNSLLQTDASPLGLYIDKVLGNTASSAWTLFTAATVTDDGVRNQLVQYAWDRASFNKTSGQFPDVYNDATGAISSSRGGNAGSALGAMFAPLALTMPNTTITADGGSPLNPSPSGGVPIGNNGSNGSNGRTNVGAIVGGVVGGAAFLGILAGVGIFFWRRRRQQASASNYHYKEDLLEHPHPYQYEAAYEQEYQPNRYTDTNTGRADAATRTSPTDAPYTSPYPVSSKARERAREMEQRYPQSPSGTTNPTTPVAPSSEMISSGSEASSGGLDANTVSTTDLLGLRTEVENLRRVMQGIREERLDPPPLYGN